MKLSRNGTRQPHDSGSHAVAARKTRFPSKSPAGTPICGQLP
jgi:hypothetical protein